MYGIKYFGVIVLIIGDMLLRCLLMYIIYVIKIKLYVLFLVF